MKNTGFYPCIHGKADFQYRKAQKPAIQFLFVQQILKFNIQSISNLHNSPIYNNETKRAKKAWLEKTFMDAFLKVGQPFFKSLNLC